MADTGSITRASHAVSVAQPSLSRQLRQLEAEIGERLLDRSQGRARLTAAGRVLLPLARDLVGRADQAAATMRALADATHIPVRIVAPETTVADVIAPFLATRPVSAPVVDVREALPAEVYADVVAGLADVGISSGPPPRQLASRLLVHFPILAYVRADHRWSRRQAVGVAELAREPLIVLGPEHGTRRLLDAAMADAGLSFALAAQTDVPQVAQALAASGRGVAVVSDDARYGLLGLRILGTVGAALRVPLFAAWDVAHYNAHAIAGLADDLADYAASRDLTTGAGTVSGGRRKSAAGRQPTAGIEDG